MTSKFVGSLIINIFYPPICPLCARFVEIDGVACRSCSESLQPLEAEANLPHLENNYVDRCLSCFAYEGLLRKAIHAFKYDQGIQKLKFFSNAIFDRIAGLDLFDLIVPVPIHKSRIRSRGYNQAALIAARLSRETGIGLSLTSILRIINNKPQMELDRIERLHNMKGSFSTPKGSKIDFHDRSILLVDDVVTTGATLNECAKVLKKAGASKVQAITVARTLG